MLVWLAPNSLKVQPSGPHQAFGLEVPRCCHAGMVVAEWESYTVLNELKGWGRISGRHIYGSKLQKKYRWDVKSQPWVQLCYTALEAFCGNGEALPV